MRQSIISLLLILSALSCLGQPKYPSFKTRLNYDTILFYNRFDQIAKPLKSNHDFNVNVDNFGFLYFIVDNEQTDGNFKILKLNTKYVLEDSFMLVNSFKGGYRKGQVVDLSVYKDRMCILTYNGWQVFSLESKTLISEHKFSSSKDFFLRTHIVNDSILFIARAKSNPSNKSDTAMHVRKYNYLKNELISSFSIQTTLPQLSFYGPNHRISFFQNEIYFCDFNEYRAYRHQINQPRIEDVIFNKDYHSNHTFKDKLKTTKIDNQTMYSLIEEHFENNMLILHDINVVDSSNILLRVKVPQNGNDTSRFNHDQFHLWHKNKHTNQFELQKIVLDENSYEFNKDTDSIMTKEFYYKGLATNHYFIVNGKLYVIYWSGGIYPIGLSKQEYLRKEKLSIFTNGSIPTILVYDLKNLFD